MRKGYKYLGVIWPSVFDCDEIEFSIYQEEIYNFAMRRLADSPNDWQRRVKLFEQQLIAEAKNKLGRKRKEIIMD